MDKLTKASKELEHLGEIKPVQCNIRKEEEVRYRVAQRNLDMHYKAFI